MADEVTLVERIANALGWRRTWDLEVSTTEPAHWQFYDTFQTYGAALGAMPRHWSRGEQWRVNPAWTRGEAMSPRARVTPRKGRVPRGPYRVVPCIVDGIPAMLQKWKRDWLACSSWEEAYCHKRVRNDEWQTGWRAGYRAARDAGRGR